MIKIGVYGTLKKNFYPNHILKEGNAKLIKEGYYKIPYKMFHTGYFPFLQSDDKNNNIYLEIYEIDKYTENNLDIYEGYPVLFEKNTITIDNEDITIYVGGKEFKNSKNYKIIENGNFEGQKKAN